MGVIINEKGKLRINRFLEWALHMIAYTLVFILVTSNFDSIYINTNHYYSFAFLAVFIIYVLNRTIKPLLVTLTIPITGLTLGLFYPFINFFILKLTDWILWGNFELNDFWVAALVAVLLSLMNLIVEKLIIDPLTKKVKKNG